MNNDKNLNQKIVKKKKITHKTITTKNKIAKTRTEYNKARDVLSWRTCGLDKTFVERLCDELYEWGKRRTSINLLDFYHSWGMPKQTFHDYMNKHADIKFIHEIVKEMIGSRREKLAMFKKYECNEKTIHRTLHLYHPDWKQVNEEEKDFKLSLSKDEQNQKPTNFTVVMQSYEDTELVLK